MYARTYAKMWDNINALCVYYSKGTFTPNAMRCVALRCRGAVRLVASLSPWHAAVYRNMPRTIAHVPKTQVNARGRVGPMSPHVIATHRSATHLCKRNLHGHHAFCFSSKISATGDVCASKRLTYLSNSWFRWNQPDSHKCRRYTCRDNSCFHVNTVLQPFRISTF